MYYLLLTLLLIDAVLLMVVVLLQAGKGGGLAAMGAAGAGSDTLFGSRQAATLLTKATWWTGGVFLVLSFALSLMAGGAVQGGSILRTEGAAQFPQPAPAVPGTFGTGAPAEAPAGEPAASEEPAPLETP